VGGDQTGAAPAKKSPGTSPEIVQSQSRRANAEKLHILQRKRWRLYFFSSERKIARELCLQASCSSVIWGGMADSSVVQRGLGRGNLACME